MVFKHALAEFLKLDLNRYVNFDTEDKNEVENRQYDN